MLEQPPTDLDDDLPEVRSMQVKNVSAREYVDVVGSVVYRFKPGETKVIHEHKDRKRDEFGSPIVGRKSSARGPDGRRITKAVALVTAKGGTLDEIWKYLNTKAGNPLVRLKGDGKDLAREQWKMKTHAEHALREARYQVAQWMRRCAENKAAGIPVEDKPHYIFDAEQDIRLFSKSSDEKRFKVTIDGARFNTKAECETHIKTTPWLLQYADTWMAHVEDLKGDDVLRDPHIEAFVPPPSAAGNTNATVLGVLRMAEKAGKKIPLEIQARLGTDPKAIEEAMDIIMAEDEEDPNVEKVDQPTMTREQGEHLKDFAERKKTGETREAFKARKEAEREAKKKEKEDVEA